VDLEAVRREFPILEAKVYLNSCSLGALSRRAEARLGEFLALWHGMGASAWYEHWLARIEELRGKVASFWNADASETALLPSTSAALSVVSESVPAGSRNRIVCTELDFPTLPYQWRVKPGVEVVMLPSHDGVGVEPQQFADAVDARTLFVATSHVFFATGFVQDVAALAGIAHDAGAYCLIDGYQALGQIPVDVPASGVDFYTAGPLKWLCGGPGLAYLYVRRDLIEALRPRITSWFAAENQFAFDAGHFTYRRDARRFELGTPALAAVHTALGGQEILDEVGIEAVAARNRAHRTAHRWRPGCRLQPASGARAGAFRHRDDPPRRPRWRRSTSRRRGDHRRSPAGACAGQPTLLQYRGGRGPPGGGAGRAGTVSGPGGRKVRKLVTNAAQRTDGSGTGSGSRARVRRIATRTPRTR